MSSRMVITTLTTDFLEVSTRVGAFERPAERRELMAVKKAVLCASGMVLSAENGSWSSNLGFCRKRELFEREKRAKGRKEGMTTHTFD